MSSDDESIILMFYELYKIPIKYRKIMKEIIINNRLIKRTFHQMLLYTKKEKKERQKLEILKDWEIMFQY
jgi:hypothetical protein